MKPISLLPLLVLLLVMAGCSKEVYDNPYDTHLANISTSDCLMHTDLLAAKDMALDSITVAYADGTLSVTHHNMMLDCGSGEGIATTMQMVGDTIMVTEDVGEQGRVDCLCLYNNSFYIVDLPQSPFTLVIKEVAYFCGNAELRIVYQHTF
ncbi:MAG: hypothetical protein J5641_06980 [Bacteroidales bacterium]|nr:hypothetical protein [Bacteroidales bacterium]